MIKATRRGSQAAFVFEDPKQKVAATSAPAGALVADLMEKAGAGWYQAMILPSLLGVTVVECGQVQLVSSIVGALQVEWSLSEQQRALLPALAFVGLAGGTLLSGVLSDAMGRRKTVLMGYLLCSVSSVLLAMAGTYRQMLGFALCNGFAAGVAVTAAMVMITELCPRGLRASAFVLPLLAQALGEVYAVAMTEVFMPDLLHGNWRAVVIFTAMPAYVFLFMSFFILRESPYWLVVQGRLCEARTEILEIARMNRTSQHVEILAQSLEAADGDAAEEKKDDAQGLVPVMRKAFASPTFFRNFASFSYLCFLGQLLTFGMSYYWPVLLESPNIVIDYMNPATTLGLIRSFGIPSALMMVPMMQSQVGHRWIIASAGVLEGLTLLGCLLVLTYSTGSALVPLACLSLGCANLFYAVSLLFMSESYPTTVRAVMSALSISLGRIGAICGPSMVEYMGFSGFLAFTSVMACSAVPLVLGLTETKGKQLEDFLAEEQPQSSLPAAGSKGDDEDDDNSDTQSDRSRQRNV